MSGAHSISQVPPAAVDYTYEFPPLKRSVTPAFSTMTGSAKPSAQEKDRMIAALRSHRINTLVELRRIEKAFAKFGSLDVNEPITSAWRYYVDSHGLLLELRGLTKDYPFSSGCIEEAKKRVYADPQSNCSWNFCWLVLSKIKSDQLVPYFAQYEAALPTMWGGQQATEYAVTQLSEAFVTEWEHALARLLEHWSKPPVHVDFLN